MRVIIALDIAADVLSGDPAASVADVLNVGCDLVDLVGILNWGIHPRRLMRQAVASTSKKLSKLSEGPRRISGRLGRDRCAWAT